MNNNFYNVNEPFQLEVEITDAEMRKNLESLIMRSVVKGTELLPGLKVNKAYKQSLDSTDVQQSAMADEFNMLYKEFDSKFHSFWLKWIDKKETSSPAPTSTHIPTGNIPNTDANGYPLHITNCKHNCKKCQGKCLYRKEPYQSIDGIKDYPPYLDYPLRQDTDIVTTKTAPKYDGGYVDMANRSAVETMFNAVRI